MIEAINVSKHYTLKEKKRWFRSEKKTIEAVKELNLSINKGEIIGLLGLNGAGKTTTIKMLSTLLKPSSGTITVDGVDIETNPMEVKRKVNMIAGGERMLYWRLTGYENLIYFGKLYGLAGDVLRNRCQSLLENMGLGEAAHIPVERYSKGMKQRLQIARGLINDPTYLFLDEPTLGLDAPVAKHLRKSVKELAHQQGKGILLTSHYLEEVEELCDKVYIIDKGIMVLEDTPKNIIETFVKEFRVTVEVQNASTEQIHSVQRRIHEKGASFVSTEAAGGFVFEVISPFDATPLAASVCFELGLDIQRLETKKPKLEDAIIQMSEGLSA
ncbi:ABC transporter ATP-binding protein [Fictibacillus aquaticus]|uniref:ABC transporter n=1 Tax=Fictibacillus aquaticus TaxID=2021314 RepID=A0A235FDQ2_9BACL|nr:ABC transporter ATP-binding protein [Fictibacillus aquaticus]OYD59486.1 ABC transporter [Fictibacillus aquaticus]